MRRVFATAIGLVTLAACTTVDKYSGLDNPPGGYIVGSSSFQRTMADLNPFQSQYTHQWVRIRVIAPPGATRCRIADQSPFMPEGPQADGRPDAKREVMLAFDAFSDFAAFECKTPEGVVKRRVGAVLYESLLSKAATAGYFKTTAKVKPPLVHMDPADPDAEQRWQAFATELCPVVSERAFAFACKPGMLEKLKAADIGARS